MWPNPQENADLVTFTEEIVNGKLYFLCRVSTYENFSEKVTYMFISWGKKCSYQWVRNVAFRKILRTY